MKKTITAVLLTAFAGMASAQVAVYGVLDEAVRSTDGTTEMKSGSFHTSRLGVKGTEDLGGGLTASFKLEGKLDVSNGDMTGDEMFNRESSVSIGSASMGTITLGRTDTSAAEGIDSVAGFGNFGNFALVGSGIEYSGDRANTIRYTSPDIAGLQVQIGQSEAVGAAEKLNSGSVTFKNGFLSAGVGYDRTASGDTYKAVGANVNIGGATVGAMYGLQEADVETKVTIVSGRVPFGAFALLAAHNITDVDGADTKTTTVGASYDLSKRTLILLAYQDQEGDTSDFFQVGVKHSF